MGFGDLGKEEKSGIEKPKIMASVYEMVGYGGI